MRPNTLAEAVDMVRSGAARDIILAEFVDTFDMAKTDSDRYASIEQEPRLTGDKRLDALVGAIAEYLAKQRRLGRVPHWVSDPARRLDSPWFTTESPSDSMRGATSTSTSAVAMGGPSVSAIAVSDAMPPSEAPTRAGGLGNDRDTATTSAANASSV